MLGGVVDPLSGRVGARLLGARLPKADGSAIAGDSVIAAADGVGQSWSNILPCCLLDCLDFADLLAPLLALDSTFDAAPLLILDALEPPFSVPLLDLDASLLTLDALVLPFEPPLDAVPLDDDCWQSQSLSLSVLLLLFSMGLLVGETETVGVMVVVF